MSWFPYGKMAADLARAVLSGDIGLAMRHAEFVVEEAAKQEKFKVLEDELYVAAEGCRWQECDRLLSELERIGIIDSCHLVEIQSMVAFERGTNVLDYITGRLSDG